MLEDSSKFGCKSGKKCKIKNIFEFLTSSILLENRSKLNWKNEKEFVRQSGCLRDKQYDKLIHFLRGFYGFQGSKADCLDMFSRNSIIDVNYRFLERYLVKYLQKRAGNNDKLFKIQNMKKWREIVSVNKRK